MVANESALRASSEEQLATLAGHIRTYVETIAALRGNYARAEAEVARLAGERDEMEARGYARGIEDAAKWHDAQAKDRRSWGMHTSADTFEAHAADIRALATPSAAHDDG